MGVVKRNVPIVTTQPFGGWIVIGIMETCNGETREGQTIELSLSEARLLAESLLADAERIEQKN